MPGVLRITKAASIALHTTALLAASPSRRYTIKEISEHFDSSAAHLSKVCQRLARQGILEVVRGPSGGYRLVKDPAELNLREIYEAVEGPMMPLPCLFDEQLCKGGNCIMGPLLHKITGNLVEHFASTTLASVANSFDLGDTVHDDKKDNRD